MDWSVKNATKTFEFRSSCLVAFRIPESKSSFDVRIRGLIRFRFSAPNGMDQTLRRTRKQRPKNKITVNFTTRKKRIESILVRNVLPIGQRDGFDAFRPDIAYRVPNEGSDSLCLKVSSRRP